MDTKRLENEVFALGSAVFLQDLMRPAYKIYEFNAEESEPPATTSIDISLDRSETKRLTAALDEMQERPSYKVININCSGWFVIQVEGDRAFIHGLVGTVESFGAERIVS